METHFFSNMQPGSSQCAGVPHSDILQDDMQLRKQKLCRYHGNATTDLFFKTLFRDPSCTAVLLRMVIPELRSYDVEIIASCLHIDSCEYGEESHKVTRHDVDCTLLPGTRVQFNLTANIEMQQHRPQYDIIKRAIYYTGCQTQSHLKSGVSYDQIGKIYSIWLCIFPSDIQEQSLAEYCVRRFEYAEYNKSRNCYEYNSSADVFHTVLMYLPNILKTPTHEFYDFVCNFMSSAKDIISYISEQFKDKELVRRNLNMDLDALYNHEENLAWAKEEGVEESIRNTVISYVRNGIDYKLSITLLMSTFQLSSEEAVQKYEMYKGL